MVTNGSAAAAFMPGNPGDELADFARTTIAAHFGLAISCGIHYDPYRALDKARSARDEIWPLGTGLGSVLHKGDS